MAGFIIVIIIIGICVLLFAKTDTKRSLLNDVGLDLSSNSYKNGKENEFEKYCKKAMKVAIEDYDVNGKDENDFLQTLEDVLFTSTMGPYRYDRDYDPDNFSAPTPNYQLRVKDHYAKFASQVVRRRREALKKPGHAILMSNCDYKSKQDLKK